MKNSRHGLCDVYKLEKISYSIIQARFHRAPPGSKIQKASFNFVSGLHANFSLRCDSSLKAGQRTLRKIYITTSTRDDIRLVD